MAPGNRDVSLVAVSLLSFVGLLALVGYVYEKFKGTANKERRDETNLGDTRECSGELRAEKSSEKDGEKTCNNLYGELDRSQIVHLLNLLDKADDALLEKILVTLSNSCAFTASQNLVRENGGFIRIIQLVDHWSRLVRLRALQTLANLSMNLENQKHIKDCIPIILSKISPKQVEYTNDDEIIAILQLLVNITVVDTWHADLVDSILYCLNMLEQQSLSIKTKTNAFRLLVNFSCNAENADFFFKEKRLEAFENILADAVTEDNILRALTIMANIVKAASSGKTDTTLQEFQEIQRLQSSLTTEQCSVKEIARTMSDNLKIKLSALENNENEEIRDKVFLIWKILESY